MLPKSDWAHLIPHAGGMCLLDAVLVWDADTLHASSESHVRRENPLRGPHGLHAVHLAEYGAQAMAVHGALLARARRVEAARPGMLVSLREVQLQVEYVPRSGRLDVHAQCLYADDSGAQYAFRVEHGGRLLASGRAAVIHPQEAQP
jgi:predicted hotdog family 3-hydroxylacyl-ACP dehydratase